MSLPLSDELICIGDWSLGTACGRCSRCLATKPVTREDIERRLRLVEALRDRWSHNPGYARTLSIDVAALRMLLKAGDPMRRLRHVKRGTTYHTVGIARLQTKTPLLDDEEVVVYRGEDGALWVRSKGEFEDGRFVWAGERP